MEFVRVANKRKPDTGLLSVKSDQRVNKVQHMPPVYLKNVSQSLIALQEGIAVIDEVVERFSDLVLQKRTEPQHTGMAANVPRIFPCLSTVGRTGMPHAYESWR